MSELDRYDVDSLCTVLSPPQGDIILRVPLDWLGPASITLDIAQGYLDALFIGETIAPFCQSIALQQKEPSIYFAFRPRDVEGLAAKLLWLSPGFNIRLYDDIDHERHHLCAVVR